MAGIHNYFHGENGTVNEKGWFIDRDGMGTFLRIDGSIHRSSAYDYGSDIGIDPLIQVGDKIVYLRLNEYTGLYTRPENTSYASVENACERVIERRKHLDEYKHFYNSESMESWAAQLSHNTEMPVELRQPSDDSFTIDETPRTRLSTFLSYSNSNILLARQLNDSMRSDADIDVWFDIYESDELQVHKENAERWLKNAIYNSKVFLLLLSQSAIESNWVKKEIEWAQEMMDKDSEFNFIALKIDEVSADHLEIKPECMVDCGYLRFHEILEESYAAIFRRIGRLEWLSTNSDFPQHTYHPVDPLAGPYDNFISDSGIAISVRWRDAPSEPLWSLEYESKDGLRRVNGYSELEILDPDIKSGDFIGYAHMLGLFTSGNSTIWMRSRDLNINISDVHNDFRRKLVQLHSL